MGEKEEEAVGAAVADDGSPPCTSAVCADRDGAVPPEIAVTRAVCVARGLMPAPGPVVAGVAATPAVPDSLDGPVVGSRCVCTAFVVKDAG